MTIKAVVVADSISEWGKRLTSLQITMHRFVLAEFNTHRVFSRNFRSSRAVPVHKLIAEVRSNPATPVSWRSNKPGMQGGEDLTGDAKLTVEQEWVSAALDAADRAEAMMKAGLHKSWANRVLEPFLYVHGIVTSTEWSNFFALRIHPDAQPEICVLAEAVRDAMAASTPKVLKQSDWHTPYCDEEILDGVGTDLRIKLSVARCARVSYLTQEGKKPDTGEDLKLYDRLVGSVPLHASPAEHQGTPSSFTHGPLHGNFVGWEQFRKRLHGESQ
jgi:thymidylate synthase ThyX